MKGMLDSRLARVVIVFLGLSIVIGLFAFFYNSSALINDAGEMIRRPVDVGLEKISNLLDTDKDWRPARIANILVVLFVH